MILIHQPLVQPDPPDLAERLEAKIAAMLAITPVEPPIVRRDLPWLYDDVVRVLKYVADGSPWVEDSQSSDYCIYCNRHVGNVDLARNRDGLKDIEMHKPNCIYLLASDMLTGIA